MKTLGDSLAEAWNQEFGSGEGGLVRGVVSTHHPDTGVKRVTGEIYYYPSGHDGEPALPFFSLQKSHPQTAAVLVAQLAQGELERDDAVSIVFCLEGGKLRVGFPTPLTRTPRAAVKLAVDLGQQKRIDHRQAVLRVSPEEVRRLLLPTFDPIEERQAQRQGRVLARGQGAWGGVCSGRLAFSSARCREFQAAGDLVVVARPALSYLDRGALLLASGVLLSQGATLAAEHQERPTLIVPELQWDGESLWVGEHQLHEGDLVSLDASRGQLLKGPMTVVPGEYTPELFTLLGWADEFRDLELRANVGSVEEAAQAHLLGARGVGLCRLESLFFSSSCLNLFQEVFREISLGRDGGQAGEELVEVVARDLGQLLAALEGSDPVSCIVRFLDAPLAQMLAYWRELHALPSHFFEGPLEQWMAELNPIHGCRLGRLTLLFPDLLRLQIKACLRAAKRSDAHPSRVRLQLMVPGVCDSEEIRLVRKTAEEMAQGLGLEPLQVGTMLELPRACLTADRLAQQADFFSFGTGDLTEATCGVSRYDAPMTFLPEFLSRGVLAQDPFQSIDQEAVGQLMAIALGRVKEKYPSKEMGTCGAQATEPESLAFCRALGLDYVSVPVHHLPRARLAAAQAALKDYSK